MKIADVATESYSWPRKRPIRNGKYTYTNAGLERYLDRLDDLRDRFDRFIATNREVLAV